MTLIELEKEEPLIEELMDHFWPETRIIHHPLIVARCNPRHAADVNAIYQQKFREVEEALANCDWESYVFLHERPYRVEALVDCVTEGLTGEEYWRLIGCVWTDSENIHQALSIWKGLWSKECGDRQFAMDEKERAVLAAMPETIPVWRGTSHRQSVPGLSWTFEAKKAEYFARRFQEPGTECFVASGLVQKADVYAVFLRRGEFEIICRQVKILNVTAAHGRTADLSNSCGVDAR